MTHDESAAGSLDRLAAEIDGAIPGSLRREWSAHVAREQVLVGRQGIFTATGELHAFQLSFRTPGHREGIAAEWGSREHERATAHVLRATFERTDLEHVAQGRDLFVRAPRAYLTGDLPVPRRPDRLLLEVSDCTRVDADLVAGIRALQVAGYRIALPAFVASSGQMQLLPRASVVKIDVRDLDVEGRPLMAAAQAYGAVVVAEYVETPEHLEHARALGCTLFQGNLLGRAGILDRTHARLVGPQS